MRKAFDINPFNPVPSGPSILICENCGTEKPADRIRLLTVYVPPTTTAQELLFICDDCNVSLTEQGYRLLTFSETMKEIS